jgi:hypothetical protein
VQHRLPTVLKGGKMNNVFTVWAGGVEINSHYLSKAEAESLLAEMQSHGYDDVQIENAFPDLVDFRGKPTMCRIIQRHSAGTADIELPSGNCYRVSGLSTGQTA